MHHKQLTNASAEVAIVTALKSSWQMYLQEWHNQKMCICRSGHSSSKIQLL